MYLSLSQILISLGRLSEVHPFYGYGFLAFKKARIPVGDVTRFTSRFIREEVLMPYFSPVEEEARYFNPFKSTVRWVKPRYESTSLQRVIADTFGSAFIHPKGSSLWGWTPDYVQELQNLMFQVQSGPIPLLDLAVWLYRRERLPSDPETAMAYLSDRFIRDFDLQEDELSALFTTKDARSVELSTKKAEDHDVIDVFGGPEGTRGSEGVILHRLKLSQVGPAARLELLAKSRLNIFTGDNSLGKTFLLDCIWWAVTGHWARLPAEPTATKGRIRSEISYSLVAENEPEWSATAPYDPVQQDWQRPDDRLESLAIYADHTGAVTLWDPLQAAPNVRVPNKGNAHLVLTREEVWHGRKRSDDQRSLCNGLVSDWVTWQLQKELYRDVLRAFEGCLRELSPPDGPELRPGPIGKIPGDERPFPTIRMPYGHVPVSYASAGIQRILGLAYMLVWHWNQHTRRSEVLSRDPLKRVIVIIDEIEAHLHPRWQRQIVPALLRTLRTLSPHIRFQLHIATHSPLVLASVEPTFNLDCDQIHHLSLDRNFVTLTDVIFAKQGTADSWLESPVFGLRSSRSAEAEKAIEQAKAVQRGARISVDEVRELNLTLRRVMPDDDPFWVRWTYFYERTVGEVD